MLSDRDLWANRVTAMHLYDSVAFLSRCSPIRTFHRVVRGNPRLQHGETSKYTSTVQYIVLEIGTAGAVSLISNIDQEINPKEIGAAARRREIRVQFPKSVNFLGVSAVSQFPRPGFQGNIRTHNKL